MGATERSANTPVVYLEGADGALVENSNLKCLMIEDRIGEMPSRAIFQYVFGRDKRSPISMTPADSIPIKYGRRVAVKQPGSTRVVFNGYIMKRSDQGGPDKIIYQALCDKHLLKYIPVTGCLIRDSDGNLRFSARHTARMNPDGAWNCTYTDEIGGLRYPVFTPAAYRGSTYEAPNAAFDAEGYTTAGKHTAWTPRRALAYLWMLANLKSVTDVIGAIDGLEEEVSASLAVDGDLGWSYGAITGMQGKDPDGAPTDPLDRKLPDMTLQGRTLGNAIDTVLQAAGTHAIRLNYTSFGSEPPAAPIYSESQIAFQNVGWAPQGSGDWSISIQRGGSVGEDGGGGYACDAFDFSFDEDASGIAENVAVLGDVKRCEGRLEFKRTNGVLYDADVDSGIIPAWTYAEECAFRAIIHGVDLDGTPPSDYALVPPTFGDVDIAAFEDADGNEGRPFVRPRTPEAIALARSYFPHVYHAWRINGANADVNTLLNVPDGTTTGGILKAPRPVMAEQLQYLVRDLSADASTENRMFTRLPIRLEIAQDDYAGESLEWQEVPKDISARVTGDGTIWIDGIAEEADGLIYSVLPYSLYDTSYHKTGTDYPSIRRIRVNVAIPSDYRVLGYDVKTSSQIDGSIRNAFAGKSLLRVIDSPGAYIHHIQTNSYPSKSPSYYDGETGDTPTDPTEPLNRDLPPGPETEHAQYAASRVMARSINPKREFSFRSIGIRTDWRAGDRVSYIWLYLQPIEGGGSTNWQYNLSAPVTSITHDYINQITSVGGVATEFGGGFV